MDNYNYLATTGTIVPNTNDVLVAVQNAFKSAFGQDLVVDPETPQGILIAVITQFMVAMVQNNALLANQFNPNLSGGVFLDALWALTGGSRSAGTYSKVNATLSGVAGTIVPANSIAKTKDGDEFALTTNVTIPGTGEFQAVNPGAVLCDIGALAYIVTPVNGWETINNDSAAFYIGTLEQSDFEIRTLRNQTLAIQGMGLIESIYGRIRQLNGVDSIYAQENTDSVQHIINGVTMKPHSIYICVDGGIDIDIATTLTAVKNGGCAYNNANIPIEYQRNVPVTNTISGQTINVLFDRPVLIPIYIIITIRKNTAISDIDTVVKQAIIDYANGQYANEPGFGIGQAVSPLELAGAVNQRYPQIFVTDLTIGTGGNPTSRETLPIPVYAKASITNNASIVVKQI